jgi:GxxExxY protein
VSQAKGDFTGMNGIEGIDTQARINWDLKMHLEELTEGILKVCFEVSNELGCGFIESVYQKALLIALREAGLRAESQYPLTVMFRGQIVGEFFADIVVNESVLLELKAVKTLAPEHLAQVMNYLKATGIQVGLLVNFGNPKLEYRRFGNRF